MTDRITIDIMIDRSCLPFTGPDAYKALAQAADLSTLLSLAEHVSIRGPQGIYVGGQDMKSQTQAILKMLIAGWTSTKAVAEQTGSTNFHKRRAEITLTYFAVVHYLAGWKGGVEYAGHHYNWESRTRKCRNRYGKSVTVKDWRLVKV